VVPRGDPASLIAGRVSSECEYHMPSFIEQLQALQAEASAEIDRAETTADLTAIDRDVLGGKGKLTLLMRQLGSLSADERPDAGRESNRVKLELTSLLNERRESLHAGELTAQLESERIDVTLPGRTPQIGVVHPVFQMIEELSDIFALMGFQTVFGREVESGYYNFDQLNIPSDHPARDVWDTFLVESDGASHEWMFHQLEGLAVDEHITLADLKGVLQELARQLFGPKRKIRFRCDFFPFVEPGVDFAVDCAICDGIGCRVCKQSGWLEMGGAGMVHRKVLEAVGYDPERYSGFAFGLGIERMVMMRHGVDDVRAFAGTDLRFLQQFAAKAVGSGSVTA
jgi:phenylalanyl-tRNA synthetase alpha chain